MATSIDADQVKSLITAVKGADQFSEETLQQFIDFIATAPEEELFRTSPLRYAEKTGVSQLTAINLFLSATSAGVFEFTWGTLCPSCGAFINSKAGLKHVRIEQHCSLCALPYSSDTDNDVEIAFTVSPAIRPLRFHHPERVNTKNDWMHMMFSSSISHFPEGHQILHSSYVTSYQIEANQTEEIEVDLEPNHYIFINPAIHAAAHIPVDKKHEGHNAHLEMHLDGQLLPETTPLAPGPSKITVSNLTDQAIIVGLYKDPHMSPIPTEERSFPIAPLFNTTPYLTSKQLVTNQTFRNLFESESIPADEGLPFNNLTFLFTDLKGSTELYDRLGDLEAYTLINSHFDMMRGIIAEKSGAVVKTMGDAIMASFALPEDAVVAACKIKSKTKTLEGSEDLILKIGIHSGPSTAINTNEQLDFFGQTVNIASRIQHAAEADQITITKAVYDAKGVQEAIQATDLTVIEEQGSFKGVSGDVSFFRLE